MIMRRPFDEIREYVRKALLEIAPALAAGRTLDINGLKSYLQQKGVFGQEDNIVSIVEGNPTEKVMNDMMEYIAFHKLDASADRLSAEEILKYYLEWNGLNLDSNEVLAFSISEAGA